MSEENIIVELNDEDLKQVSGGKTNFYYTDPYELSSWEGFDINGFCGFQIGDQVWSDNLLGNKGVMHYGVVVGYNVECNYIPPILTPSCYCVYVNWDGQQVMQMNADMLKRVG